MSTPGVSSQLARARPLVSRECAGPGGNARSAAWLAAAGAGKWAPRLWEKTPLNRPWYLDFAKGENGHAQNLGLTRPIGDTYRTREAKPRNPAAELGVPYAPGPTGGAALGEAHSSAEVPGKGRLQPTRRGSTLRPKRPLKNWGQPLSESAPPATSHHDGRQSRSRWRAPIPCAPPPPCPNPRSPRGPTS